MAYCYYKGIGVQQYYEVAARLFSSGAALGRDNSMYFYALCFANGYGVAKNADSAKFWLEKAAGLGYVQATQELKAPKAENSNDSAVSLMEKIANTTLPEKTNLNDFRQVKAHIPATDLINGEYAGYVIRYDWSGKYIISTSQVKLSLRFSDNSSDVDSNTGKNIEGTWEEQEGPTVPLSAKLNGDSVIFNKTSYRLKDHYSWDKQITYDFNEAKLNLIQSEDSVYLSGSIEMFSPERNEPSKPVYIALVRSAGTPSGFNDSIANNSINTGDKNKGLADSPSGITSARIYPNPFHSTFTVEFILTVDAEVAIQLVNMGGATVYRKPKAFLTKGKYTINLDPGRIAGGMYILRLIGHNNEPINLKVIKD